jgi:hypothetical protein
MKKSITLFILFLFVFQSTSSLWIIGTFYINQDYIAKNICVNRFDAVPICNGQCFLTKELKASEKKEQKIPNSTYKEVQLFCENEMQFSFAHPTASFKKSYPILQKDNQKSTYFSSIYNPPKCA